MSEAAAPTPVPAPTPASFPLPLGAVRALVHTWLILDFFGESRRTGQPSSTLTTTIFGQAFLALVIAAVLFPDTPLVAFAGANISISTLLVGIGHLGDDRATTRRRADQALVLPSPLPLRRLLLARAMYGSFYVCLLTIGMALPPAILCAFLPGQGLVTIPAYLACACLCAGLFTTTLALALRVAERVLGMARAQLLSGSAKALLLLLGVVGFAKGARHLGGPLASLPFPAWAVQAWPPYWAGRALQGDATFVLALLGGAVALVAAALMLSRDTETGGAVRVRPGGLLVAVLGHLSRRRPALFGTASFTASMLYRSPGFRAKVLPLFGLPVGMWLLAATSDDPANAHRLAAVAAQLPAVYLPFLVAFLGAGDEPRARWVFATAPALSPAVIRHAVLLAICTHVLLPAHLILFAVSALTDPVAALVRSVFALGIAVQVGRFALRAWTEVPFSSAESGGGLDFGGLVAAALGLTLVGLGFSALALPWAAGAAALAAGTAYLTLRRSPGP